LSGAGKKTSDQGKFSSREKQTGIWVGLNQRHHLNFGLLANIVDLTRTASATQPTTPVDAEQPKRRRPLGTVDVLDEHTCRGEEVSGGLLEKHVQRMTEPYSLTTFLSLI
jgi:hypothetical protein